MIPTGSTQGALSERGAQTIHEAFVSLAQATAEITRRARHHFEERDWLGLHEDTQRRLAVYAERVDVMIDELSSQLGERAGEQQLWRDLKAAYSQLITDERNAELARTFFNSATRRIFSTVGVNPEVEFLPRRSAIDEIEADPRTFLRHRGGSDTRRLILDILQSYSFAPGYRDAEGDAALAAQRVDGYLRALPGHPQIDRVETLRPVFFRNKGAYIIGRICSGDRYIPLLLALLNSPQGVYVDAVLMDQNDVSIVFSFARSYFHVEWDCPRELIVFLKSVMPRKPVAELYISLGFNKHGKTELYRSLQSHLERTDDRFEISEGDRGMVMLVFALPMFDVVFKVIRDQFDYPKTNTRRDVMDRYRLVFKHDRVGRLVDAQEFEHLEFSRDRFTDDLLEELLAEAGETVTLQGDSVAIRHLYTERRVIPLNLYIRQQGDRAARRAVLDYGHAIKDLAAASIFPGDFLLKNFGVTRHGRVVFYDYDELCGLDECRFRRLPPPRTPEEEMESEPWFTVGKDDIFPEEFERFLGLSSELHDTFVRHHGALFTVDFWKGLQQRHSSGDLMDFFAYPQARRLR